jgi:MFS family permease
MSSTFPEHGGAPGTTPEQIHRMHAHAKVAPGEIAVGVIVGRMSEYFDFFVFGISCVLVFPSVVFPFASLLDGILYSFTIFSLAFIARPFGTALFMSFQRRWSRGTKLTIALFLLGTSTAGMAFLPSYQDAGTWSIGLLVLFRILQGIAFGGSWDGLPSLLALNTPPQRRGWYAMLGQLSAPMGFMVAAALFLFLHTNLNQEDFIDWGWRYPFFVALAINVVALFARLRLVVTEEYTVAMEERELEPIGIFELLRTQGYNIFIGAFAALASYALFHLVTIFPLSWIVLGNTETVTEVLVSEIIGAVACIFGMIVSGLLADRIGRRTTLGLMAALIGVFALITPWLLGGGKIGQNAFIILGFAGLGLSYGQAAGSVTSNFEMRLRYAGAAFTTDFAWLIGAAFAPLVALSLSVRFGLVAVSAYLLSGVLCTLLALRVNQALAARE